MHRRWLLKMFSVLLISFAACTLTFMAVIQTASNISLKQESAAAARQPTRIQRKAVERAHEYNQRLADSGQLVLGEAPDPFSNDTTSASLKDEDYQSALNMDGDGMMGSISIPKINVNLPIWHGTSAKSLENGAGHMYGTSLPVGGESTHSVISAHNGMPNVLMFTYLDQMVIGDVFYIHVAGSTLAYKVDRIDVILPDRFDKLLISPGEDRVTLMTCTPYGRNTHRLLVSGIRASMPDIAPYERDAEHAGILDDPTVRAAMGVGVIAVTYAGWTLIGCRRESRSIRCRHSRTTHSNTHSASFGRITGRHIKGRIS